MDILAIFLVQFALSFVVYGLMWKWFLASYYRSRPISTTQGAGHHLRKWAGIGLATMLAFLVIANIHVGLEGSRVQGLEFGMWYDDLRPFFQPIFMLWARFVSGLIWKGASR